jgi:hypothetical protein
MMDMVSPADLCAVTIEDLIRPDKRLIAGMFLVVRHRFVDCFSVRLFSLCYLLIGVLFDVLFNLHKFMRFESRDPFQEKLRREDVFHTDWDRYAHIEYNRLAQEDDDGYDVSMDVDMQNHAGNAAGGGNAANAGGSGEAGAGGDGRFGSEVETLGSWSLNDEESEDEEDLHGVSASMSTGGSATANSKGGASQQQWGQRR